MSTRYEYTYEILFVGPEDGPILSWLLNVKEIVMDYKHDCMWVGYENKDGEYIYIRRQFSSFIKLIIKRRTDIYDPEGNLIKSITNERFGPWEQTNDITFAFGGGFLIIDNEK